MSVGGMPQSKPFCKIAPTSISKFNIMCESGSQINEIFDFGLLPHINVEQEGQRDMHEFGDVCLGDVFR